MSALPKRYFTQAEYARLEERAEYKSQYVAGEIFAMAGVEPAHDRIVMNLSGMLYNRLRGRSSETFSSDVKVRVKAADLWTYPDLSALCGEPRYDRTVKPSSLLNPQVIFEVLSDSTKAFDRGEKFERYKQIESLAEYVLVDTESAGIEHFVRRNSSDWIYRKYVRLDDVLTLESIEVSLPLSEVYERVDFSGSNLDAV